MLFLRQKLQGLSCVASVQLTFATLPVANHRRLSSVKSKSQLLSSYTVKPPVKPWPRKLSPGRLCYIITQQQNLDLALQIFHHAGNYHPGFRHTYATFDSMIHKLCRWREFQPIRSLLNQLRNSKIKCGENVFITLIRSYGLAGNPKEAVKIFLQINDFGLQRSVRSFNTLLNALVQNKMYDSVYPMFKDSQKRFQITPNVFTCNILLKVLCNKGDMESAVKVFDEIPAMGMVPNVASYTTIMAGYIDHGDMERAKGVFDQILDRDWVPDATTYTILMDGYCKLGQFSDAMKVMDEMQENGVAPNDVTYSVAIDVLCKEKKSREAMDMIGDMLNKKYVPSSAVCCKVIDALCQDGKVEDACELWKLLLLKNCTPDNAITSTLIHWLCKEGKVWEARKLFYEFERGSIPSVLTYNTLIDWLCENGELCEAGRLWDDMVEKECMPNPLTYNMLIKGFCKMGCAEEGIRVLKEMVDQRCAPNEMTFYILIKGLCDSAGSEASISDVLTAAMSGDRVVIGADSWRVLLEKFVTNCSSANAALEGILRPTTARLWSLFK